MATRVLKVEIVGDSRGFSRAVNEIEGHTKRLATGFGRATTLIAGGFAALGGAALVGGLKSLVDEAREAERVGRITEARIKSTGGAANVSAKDVDRLTTSLSNKVGVDDDLIASGANLLLTFKGVRNEVGRGNDIFTQATRLAVDLAAGMNEGEVSAEGLKTANIQLGKALEDPLRGITALRRSGVSFTESQRDQIKVLVESGKTLEAQKIILKAVGEQFAGTAAAAADPWQRFGVVIGNIKERIGTALLPALNNVATFVVDKLIPAAEKWWNRHGPAVRDAFNEIRDAARRVTRWLQDELWPALQEGVDLIQKEVVPQLEKMKDGWDDNKDAIEGLKTSLGPLTKTIFPVLARLLKGTVEEIRGVITIVGLLARAWNFVWRLIVTANKAIASATISMAIAVLSAMSGLVDSIPGGRRSGFGRALRRGIENLKEFRTDFNREMDKLTDERVNVTARAGISWTAEAARFRQQAGRMATGGMVEGPGTGTSDSVPVWLSRGEYVVNAAATSRNLAALEHMNAPGMAAGGQVDPRLHLPAVPHAATLQSFVEGLAKGLGAAVGRGLMKAMGTLGGNFGSGSWTRAIAELRADGVPFDIISTFRAGARTHASGSVSYHALNRAVDLTGPNMLRIFNSLVDTNPTELIYAFADVYKSRSGWHPISRLDPITWRDHTGHVHAAYDKGGWLRPGWTMAWNGTGRSERVLPPGGGGPTVVINIGTVLGGDARRVARELEPAIRNALKASLGREGKPLAKQL